ncbi:uncharacterized protein F5891DRAFT_1188034 [Suillus fuscotomentosus]|uniref:Uncharacterized protein n=1 Tax=Suillus fuscotomentosus TaxID=1912939 RepID=A0AAD4E9J6_9AGAM|nr:uncharacterized protein F5891DRAFT_1188034 [Suillus fuscotomentosus]KAG1900934.1 hypothetical protein F5891DRAFT_1188034 [Suillus fuscotomentosus]
MSHHERHESLHRVDTGFDEVFLDDNFLSAIGSFKPDGEWTGAETSAFGIGFQMSATGDYILPSTSAAANMELHPPVPVTVSTGSKCNTTPPELTTFLPIPITGIALANGPLPKSHYVICDPALFAQGIEYTNETLKITFPAAAACIRDAAILARQCLTTHGIQETSFRIACKDFIIEMMTVAKHAGQPVEQGFKCRDTNKVKPLDMVYYERYRFVKFLKENCSTFAEDLRKKALGGFCLEDYHAGTVGPYVTQLTGLTLWNDEVTSINFACSSNGKYYCRIPILVILALCILQPLRVQHRSLLDLFPAQYERLPEHLIASACGMYTIFFKHRLPGYLPSAQISTDNFEKEADHQLQLLRFIRQHTNEEAHRLNTWINTRCRNNDTERNN